VSNEQLDQIAFVLERRQAALNLGLGRAQQVRREHGRQVLGSHQIRLPVTRYPARRQTNATSITLLRQQAALFQRGRYRIVGTLLTGTTECANKKAIH